MSRVVSEGKRPAKDRPGGSGGPWQLILSLVILCSYAPLQLLLTSRIREGFSRNPATRHSTSFGSLFQSTSLSPCEISFILSTWVYVLTLVFLTGLDRCQACNIGSK